MVGTLTPDDERPTRRVAELMETLHRVEPRHTESRLQAVQELAELRGWLSEIDRKAVAGTLARILSGNLKESFDGPLGRALTQLSWIGIVTGFVLWIAMMLFGFPAMNLIEALGLLAFMVVAIAFGLAIVGGPFFVPVHSRKSTIVNDRVRAASAMALGRLQERDALEVLASACRDRSRAVQAQAAMALDEVIEPMLEVRGGRLSADESVALARCLPRVDQDLARKVMQVLEESGATAALAPLQGLEYEWTYSRKMEGTDLPGCLRRAISRLGERREEERKRETLLRAAAPVEGESATLLRSANGTGETRAEQLLRPADPGA